MLVYLGRLEFTRSLHELIAGLIILGKKSVIIFKVKRACVWSDNNTPRTESSVRTIVGPIIIKKKSVSDYIIDLFKVERDRVRSDTDIPQIGMIFFF